MNRLLLSTAVAALILAAPAAFAADDHHDHGGGGGEQHESHESGPKAPSGGGNTNAPGHTEKSIHTDRTTGNGFGHDDHSNSDRRVKSKSNITNNFSGDNDRQKFKSNDRTGHDNSSRDNNKGGHSHTNFKRHNVTASHHFHYRGGAYRWPGGYHYQRWSYGQTLPSIFWAQDYWISDYEDYGLGYPPDGCVWVRYGNDALLIDEDSGEILEVVYGQFY
jgi:Ni/Co efflux regulator RcnB